jgi:hypothetical protein
VVQVPVALGVLGVWLMPGALGVLAVVPLMPLVPAVLVMPLILVRS